jgi:hypothetical protein
VKKAPSMDMDLMLLKIDMPLQLFVALRRKRRQFWVMQSLTAIIY